MLIIWILLGSLILFAIQRAVYSRYWDEKIRISFHFQERTVTEGETACLIERSENRKLLSLPTFGYSYVLHRNYAASAEDANSSMLLRRKLGLPGKRAVTNRARLQGLTRGVYTLGNVALSGSDLFQTLRLERPVDCSARLTVYPAKIPARKLALPVRLLLGAVTTRRMAQEDPFALKSIRDYEIYDSPKLINWKASARTGQLKVNQFDYTTDEALVFLLDMGSGSEEDREELIRLASSLSLLFLHRGVSVSVLSNCRNCTTGRPIRVRAGADLGHQISVDEALANINLASNVTESYRDFLFGVPQAFLNRALPVGISADPTGNALEAFQTVPGTRGGYFLTVNGAGKLRPDSGITLLNWNAAEGEVRL